ncbi:MAG: hypothetical protein HQL50_01215 [Magnetococcales bacterium]|nr:hypothetical protein [Magnetococcales bacterium]
MAKSGMKLCVRCRSIHDPAEESEDALCQHCRTLLEMAGHLVRFDGTVCPPVIGYRWSSANGRGRERRAGSNSA